MRDLTKPIDLTLGDRTVSLRLDMTAVADFEDAADMTIAAFLQPLVPVLRDMQERAGEEVADANAAGLQMIEDLLSAESLSARNILHLVWALAGGTDLDETPREFGRLVNIGNGGEILRAIMDAVADGMPDADPDAEATDADEDPTERPE